MIIDRKVVRGKDFFAGEFSYILRRDGENRDFSYIWGSDGGVRGLIGMIAEKKGIPDEEMDGFKAFELINSGDQEAVSALHVYCAGLATRIWNLHAVLNPDRFLIGGGISEQPILLETLRVLKKGGVFALHDIFSESKYGDMQSFVEKLRSMGYEKVELIDTTNGMFMSPWEAKWMALSGSALLVGRK